VVGEIEAAASRRVVESPAQTTAREVMERELAKRRS
jgi:hypothetical protein